MNTNLRIAGKCASQSVYVVPRINVASITQKLFDLSLICVIAAIFAFGIYIINDQANIIANQVSVVNSKDAQIANLTYELKLANYKLSQAIVPEATVSAAFNNHVATPVASSFTNAIGAVSNGAAYAGKQISNGWSNFMSLFG